MRGRSALGIAAVLVFAALAMGQDSCDGSMDDSAGDRDRGEQSNGGGSGGGSGDGGGSGGGDDGGGGAGSSTDDPDPPPPPPDEPECTPGYDPCLEPASDYDCEGGSGDGPAYTGRVTVTGSDPYDLDSDGDGVGCES